MPSRLSIIVKQTEEVLQDVLHIIQEDYERPYAVLSETDRKRFVEEEELLSKQLEQQVQSEPPSWLNLLGIPSPLAAKCLEDAEDLRRRVRDDIQTKRRTMLVGKKGPFALGRALDLMDARTPESETDTDRPAANSTVVTSPLNMLVAAQNDRDYAPALSEAMSEQLDISSDLASDTLSQRHRRTPPLLPPRRRAVQLNILSETTSSDFPRRSSSIRRPLPLPPRSPARSTRPRTPESFVANSIPSPPLSPAIMSVISQIKSDTDTLMPLGNLSAGCTKVNCIDAEGSVLKGLTMNFGGCQNGGAVIHETNGVAAPAVPRPHIRHS